MLQQVLLAPQLKLKLKHLHAGVKRQSFDALQDTTRNAAVTTTAEHCKTCVFTVSYSLVPLVHVA